MALGLEDTCIVSVLVSSCYSSICTSHEFICLVTIWGNLFIASSREENATDYQKPSERHMGNRSPVCLIPEVDQSSLQRKVLSCFLLCSLPKFPVLLHLPESFPIGLTSTSYLLAHTPFLLDFLIWTLNCTHTIGVIPLTSHRTTWWKENELSPNRGTSEFEEAADLDHRSRKTTMPDCWKLWDQRYVTPLW